VKNISSLRRSIVLQPLAGDTLDKEYAARESKIFKQHQCQGLILNVANQHKLTSEQDGGDTPKTSHFKEENHLNQTVFS
jgi:hypothetical protein